MTAHNLCKLIILLPLLLCLHACSKHPSSDFQDYLERLSNTLGVDAPQLSNQLSTKISLTNHYPSRRQLTIDIAPIKINLIEFWGFRHCGLGALIGERNAILAKVSSHSQKLFYEARLLKGLEYCQNHLEDQNQQALAKSIYLSKQKQWPDRVWNAQFAGPELQGFWNLSGNQMKSLNSDLDKLAALSQLSDTSTVAQLNTTTLEAYFKDLELHRSGGALLKQVHYGLNSLKLASQLLEEAILQKQVCPKGHNTPKAKILHNILLKIFIGGIQPQLAQINQQLERTRDHMNSLVESHPSHQKNKLNHFNRHLDHLQNQLKTQTKEHVHHWQALFSQCRAINPGQSAF